MDKNLDNTKTEDAINTTPDIVVIGDPDAWELICKAAGKRWMKSTKRRKTENGWLWQVTSEFRDESGNVTACAEAITYEACH